MGDEVRSEVHSVIVTGNEPHGGVTIVCDFGKAASPRYMMVEVPTQHVASLAHALLASLPRPVSP